MKLRIATYNIHKGVSTIGNRPRVHALKQALSALEADVIFLQEVQGRHDLLALKHAANWPAQSQHEFFADEGKHCAYGVNAVYDHGHMAMRWSAVFRSRPSATRTCPIMHTSRAASCIAWFSAMRLRSIAMSCTWACSPAAASARPTR